MAMQSVSLDTSGDGPPPPPPAVTPIRDGPFTDADYGRLRQLAGMAESAVLSAAQSAEMAALERRFAREFEINTSGELVRPNAPVTPVVPPEPQPSMPSQRSAPFERPVVEPIRDAPRRPAAESEARPLGGPGRPASDPDDMRAAVGFGPTVRQPSDEPVKVKAVEPIPVAVVNLPGAVPTPAVPTPPPTVIIPSFGLGPGRPSSADAGATPALPTKVEVLDEAGLATLVKSVGQQVADAMVNQGVVRIKRAAPVEGAPEGPAATPFAMPEMEIAPPPVTRPYQPPSEAALPAEHALEPVKEINWKERDLAPEKDAEDVPVVGWAIGAATAGAKAVAEAFNIATVQVEGFGHTMADVARNDYAAAFVHSVDTVSEAMKKIPVIGSALGAGIDLVTAIPKAFMEVTDAFVQRGREIGQYSGPLAQANAMADVRSLMGDIREAQTLGPEMARLTEAESRIWDDLRKALDPIKKVIVEVLARFLERLEPLFEALPAYLQKVVLAADALVKFMNAETFGAFGKQLDGIHDILNDLYHLLDKQADPLNPLDAFLKMNANTVWSIPDDAKPDRIPLFPPRGA